MRRLVVVLALLGLAAAAARALGAPPDVTCTPSSPTLNFGPYDVLAGSVVDAAGSFTVTCTHNRNNPVSVIYVARLAVTPTREMAPPLGTDRISYELYVDSARTQRWGDGTSSTFVFFGAVTLKGAVSVTDAPKNFYGRIAPGGQDVSASSPGPAPTFYTQGLTITVTCVPSPPC